MSKYVPLHYIAEIMLISRPTVVRTYGKSKPSASSSCSLIFESSPPTSPLLTPQASSDIDQVFEFSTRQHTDDRDGKENAPIESFITKDPKSKEKSSSSQSTLANFFNLPPNSRKRPLQPSSAGGKPKKVKDEKQMHLTHLPLLHTCSQCQMSYVRGGDDESLHEKHHAKVTRGSIWDGLGRGKLRKKTGNGLGIGIGIGEKDCGWRIVKDNVPFGPGGKGKGKVIVADGSYGGAKVCSQLSSSHLPIMSGR
jgi:N-acetyltransferase